MSRLLLASLLAVFATAVLAARPAVDASRYTSYTGFAIPAEPVLPPREIHPSLWFHAADLPALRARIARSPDAFLRRRWADVGRLADLASAPPAAPAAHDPVVAIHQYYGSMSIAARAHALLSVLVDDPAAAAAHRARAVQLLSRAYDGPIYELDPDAKSGPVDEIYRSAWMQNYAHAYDCVQPTLTPDEDRVIRARLGREAEYVYTNLYRWAPGSPHNHLSKPAWGLGSMALALSSDPRARAWLGRAIEAANRNTRYFFSGDGVYREGSHYLVFSLTNFLPFLYHYRNVAGVDAFPEFQPVFEAMVEQRDSRGWLPNIADSYLRPTPTHLAAAAYRNAPTHLHSSAPLAEVLMWSYRTCDLRPFDAAEADDGFNYTGASYDYPLAIDELLTWDPTLGATAPDADPNIFLASGISCWRTGWSARGAGERYLLFDGLSSADNHQHDDHLSFILEAEGQLMCSDSGYSRGTYAGPERTQWYATAAAHNTLTFDGRPAQDAAPNATPPSRFRVDQPGLVGEEKEAYFGQQATWNRTILWVAGDYYIVADRMRGRQPGHIASFLHGGRGGLAQAGDAYTWTYANDAYGPAARLRCWIAAPGAAVTRKSGELTYIKGDYAAYPYLETSSDAGQCAWLTVLKPEALQATDTFHVQPLSAGSGTAVRIETPEGTCLVAAQPAAGPALAAADVASDGSLVLVRRDRSGGVLAYCVLDATYLTVAGHPVWQSPQRQNTAARR